MNVQIKNEAVGKIEETGTMVEIAEKLRNLITELMPQAGPNPNQWTEKYAKARLWIWMLGVMKADVRKEHPTIPDTNEIKSFIHCKDCLDGLSDDESYDQWIEVGFTEIGLQVWCREHKVNIVHIDFEGQKHSAQQGKRPGIRVIPEQENS